MIDADLVEVDFYIFYSLNSITTRIFFSNCLWASFYFLYLDDSEKLKSLSMSSFDFAGTHGSMLCGCHCFESPSFVCPRVFGNFFHMWHLFHSMEFDLGNTLAVEIFGNDLGWLYVTNDGVSVPFALLSPLFLCFTFET